MKKILYLSVSLLLMCGLTFTICFAQETSEDKEDNKEPTRTEEPAIRDFTSPMQMFDTVVGRANLYGDNDTQNTKLNGISSVCGDISVSSNFTISTTLCNIKKSIKPYLQYIIWAGLTIATILIIRNGLKLVTSTDGEKQIKEFQKNIIYIVIGVSLIIGFYWIIDIIVSIINFVANE